MPDFRQEFDGYRLAAEDYRLYQQAKGYRYEGDMAVWEPRDPVDLEDYGPAPGPGAMTRGELEDYNWNDAEEF